MNKKILLVGGGTGGHVTPLVAIIEELITSKVPSNQIFLVTDYKAARMDYIQGHQIEVHTISSGKFHRFFSLANLLAPLKIMIGFFQSLLILSKVKPDVVLAKGAYLSAPLVFAAALKHIPIYLHESDSEIGVTNQRLAKYAKKIFVSFPVDYYNPDLTEKLIFSGLPIRKRFSHLVGGNLPLGNSNHKKIFVWGGSQGAEKLNHLVVEELADYLRRFELYHISGEDSFSYCEDIKQKLPKKLRHKYHLYVFVGREIEKIIAETDLVISRAGATSLFELAALGKAVITIPYPYAAADHQTTNAGYFFQKNAAVAIREGELDPERLKDFVFSYMDNATKRDELE